ncbi:MutS-related protein [Flexivirga caeni]|uniref:DNA mismatch repair protein MutS n=1 Tax=Flexivirga caeni TaxID=2294115 RepID=A0A3M9MJ22_9MICO|nr:DNA mismatch repair protein MutS [Flexivirga caeni]RNI24843.1 DNA mismatch repair protein MutS [Flexivirga caeni]
MLRNRSTLLYPVSPDPATLGRRPPDDTLGDLNLDQVFAAISAGCEEYRFEEFFDRPSDDLDVIGHRHEVFADLEDAATAEVIKSFVADAAAVRTRLAEKLYDPMQADRWFLGAAAAHCDAVTAASQGLDAAPLQSVGLRDLRDRLSAYRSSSEFQALRDEADHLEQGLDDVRFVVHTHAGKITVAAPGDEPDFAGSVLETFARFSAPTGVDDTAERRGAHQLDRVETAVLHMLGQLFPRLFADVAAFHRTHAQFLPQWYRDAEREAAFYLQYLEFMRTLRPAGVKWTLPRLSRQNRAERIVAGCDVALARQRAGDQERCVSNDLQLTPPEQILAISGPNQGGKTTTARLFGQLHYLASLGLPVPAAQAALFLPDAVYTHFERAESIETLSGKLEDELRRARTLLEHATGDSVVIFNETFGSTSLADAYALGATILRQVIDTGALGVYVTFVDDLTRLDEHVVSMMSTTDPADDAVRTFKVVRKRADGKVHAAAIARSHRLTYDDIRQAVS